MARVTQPNDFKRLPVVSVMALNFASFVASGAMLRTLQVSLLNCVRHSHVGTILKTILVSAASICFAAFLWMFAVVSSTPSAFMETHFLRTILAVLSAVFIQSRTILFVPLAQTFSRFFDMTKSVASIPSNDFAAVFLVVPLVTGSFISFVFVRHGREIISHSPATS